MCCHCNSSSMTGKNDRKMKGTNHKDPSAHQIHHHKHDKYHGHLPATSSSHPVGSSSAIIVSSPSRSKQWNVHPSIGSPSPGIRQKKMPSSTTQAAMFPVVKKQVIIQMPNIVDLYPSPSKLLQPVTGSAYAGAKFSDPPSPKLLPKPPVHWVSAESDSSDNDIESSTPFFTKSPQCSAISHELRLILNVQG